MYRKPGHTHIGQCTNVEVYTHAQAEKQLTEMGFTHDEETHEWVRGDERGRLCWQPDYCDPDAKPWTGTKWWLRKPWEGGEILILPKE